MADIPYISLPDNAGSFTCGCLCKGRTGPTLTAVITGILECAGFTFTDINGVFNNLQYSDETLDWREAVGAVNDSDAILVVSCGYDPALEFPCEAWQMTIITEPNIGTVYVASAFGELCPVASQFGDPIPNTQTDCFIPTAVAGIDGLITLGIP